MREARRRRWLQDLSKLKVGELTPLTPEVISRQATINIGAHRLDRGPGRAVGPRLGVTEAPAGPCSAAASVRQPKTAFSTDKRLSSREP